MFKKILSTLLLTVALAQSASAYDLSNKFGLGISGGYAIPVFGNHFNDVTDADFGYGIHGRYHYNEYFNIELGVSRQEFDDTKIFFDNLNLLGVWRLAGSSDFTPVMGLGVGGTRIKNFTPKNIKLSGLVRLGIEHGVSQWFSLGLYADYQYVSKFMGDMPSGRAHVVTPQFGLTWYFGGDKNSYQTPVQENSKEEPKAKSSGFVDESNLDSDDDGIPDPQDKCPSTPKGVSVNAIGCAIDETASMQINVEFDSGKSAINSQYEDHLKEVAAFLKKYDEVNVQIEGYTDNTGSATKNTLLSEARAKAVVSALVRLGVEKERLSARGFGPLDPIADNNTAEGRQINRRVVALLSTK